MLQFDLVSPERKLASFEASEVQIPGAEGDMTAMPDHMPLVTTLRPGIVSAKSASGTQDFVVSGGFAEVTATSLSVLAEHAMPKGEVTAAFLDGLASDGDGDAAQKRAADLAALRAELGV